MSISCLKAMSLLCVVSFVCFVNGETVGRTESTGTTSQLTARSAQRVVMPQNGSITSVSFYHGASGAQVVVGIYNDDGGNPGTLIERSGIMGVESAGWQTITLPNPVSAAAGQSLWLAWMFYSGPGTVYTTNAANGFRYVNGSTWTSDPNTIMPTSFGTATTWAQSREYSVYATYTPSGTPTTEYWMKNNNDIYYMGGNVGIGTATPNSPLDVIGAINATGMITTSNGFFCMAMQGGNAATLMGPVTCNKLGIAQDPGTEALEVSGNIKSTGSIYATSISTLNDAGNAAEFWGKVMVTNCIGIRQQPGTEALEVNGNIKCNSIKINDWTIEAPDYVFENDYKLMNLKTLEEKIKTQKHLPEVPSAAEMKEKGVDLSEMNMLLLKKVEELTLYVIAQNKKIEALEKKVGRK